MDLDQPAETLRAILDCLQRQENAKKENNDQRKYIKRSDTFSSICSMYAIIAIFIATLGVGLLSYMHDVYEARSPEITPKITDDISTVCLIFSILLSISSSIALGFGASPTLLLSLPSKDDILRTFACFLEEVFPSLRKRRISKRSQSTNFIRRCTNLRTTTLDSLNSIGSMRIPRGLPWNVAQFAIKFRSCLRKAKNGLLSTETKFVIGMLLVAVLCMALSLSSLNLALLTFAWAELGRTAAIFVTLSMLFPSSVALGISIIYRFTLLDCMFKKKDIHKQRNYLERSLQEYEASHRSRDENV